MDDITRRPLIDFNRLAEEIAAPPKYSDVLPDYLQHGEGVPRVGILTAAAIGKMYEEAAQAIEAMGDEQKKVSARAEQIMADSQEAMEECKRVADVFRRRGAAEFKRLEEMARETDRVKTTCKELKEKISVVGPTGLPAE